MFNDHIPPPQLKNDFIRPRIVLPKEPLRPRVLLVLFLLSLTPIIIILPLTFLLIDLIIIQLFILGFLFCACGVICRLLLMFARQIRIKKSVLMHTDKILYSSTFKKPYGIVQTKLGDIKKVSKLKKWIISSQKGIETAIYDSEMDLLYISFTEEEFKRSSNYERLKKFMNESYRSDYPFTNKNIENLEFITSGMVRKTTSAMVTLSDGREFIVFPNPHNPIITQLN